MQTSSRSDVCSWGWTLELGQWYWNFPSATNCVRDKSSVSCSSNHHLDIFKSLLFLYSYIQKHTRLILSNIALQFLPTACLISAKQILWRQYECIWWKKKKWTCDLRHASILCLCGLTHSLFGCNFGFDWQLRDASVTMTTNFAFWCLQLIFFRFGCLSCFDGLKLLHISF